MFLEEQQKYWLNCETHDLIEEVLDFDYLGSLITNNGDGMKEIRRRLGIAMKKLKTMTKLWKCTDEATKLKFLKSLIFPNIWFRDMVPQQASRTKDKCFPNEKFQKNTQSAMD